jgi:hypothetical protein
MEVSDQHYTSAGLLSPGKEPSSQREGGCLALNACPDELEKKLSLGPVVL